MKQRAINRQDTYISPTIVLLVNIKRFEILGTSCIGAIITLAAGLRIRNVATVTSDEFLHVTTACCRVTSWQRDISQLGRLALDLDIPRNRFEETTDQIREWVEVVDPVAPEGLDLRVGNDNATEVNEPGTNEDRVCHCCEVIVRGVGCDGLTD